MDDDLIRRRAFELWQRAGEPFGQADHFWELARNAIIAEETPELTLADRLKEYDFHDRRSLKHLGGWISGKLYTAEQRVHLGARGEQKPVLWYYTNGTTLMNMLSSGEIWSTQVTCLNDSQEIRHGLALMRDVLELQDGRTFSTGEERDFSKFLIRNIASIPRSFGNCFLACFSEKRNDLSQWRGYSGGESGFSVGFDSILLESALVHTTRPRFVKVEYDDLENRRKLRLLLDILFEVFRANLSSYGGSPRYSHDVWMEALNSQFQSVAMYWVASMKHNAFKDEAEWRLIFDVYEHAPLRYLQKSTMITRHFPISFPELHKEHKLLPIREILVGPSRHPEVSKRSVEKILADKQYQHLGWKIDVNTSAIPFQVP